MENNQFQKEGEKKPKGEKNYVNLLSRMKERKTMENNFIEKNEGYK